MTTPLYKEYEQKLGERHNKPGSAHPGLWFERFFNGFDKNDDWKIPKPTENKNVKKDWIDSVSGNCGDQTQLDRFNQRRRQLVDRLQGKSRCYKTDWHFVTGMGNPHPVENGFSWHHTLAVPYLPGSAVKGLVRAWVEIYDEALEDKQEKIKRLTTWFGTADKSKVAEQTGAFIFFDALPKSKPTLICDIMTPHMGKWYEEGGNNPTLKSDAIPADWHEPVPVHFLAVKNAEFIFSIAARNPSSDAAELDLVFTALKNALEWLGAGAKTAVGYGYMTEQK
jgi:CRISPR-associated protein Cmr6